MITSREQLISNDFFPSKGTPADISLGAIRERIQLVVGVEEIHDLHVWSLTSLVNAMSVHVVLQEGFSHDDVLFRVKTCVTSEFKIAHLTIQLEKKGFEESEIHL